MNLSRLAAEPLGMALGYPGKTPAPAAPSHRRPRAIEEAIAFDEHGDPIRIENFHAPCGAAIFVGWVDYDGAHWRPEFHASAEWLAEAITHCPQCGAALTRAEVVVLEWPATIPKLRYEMPQTVSKHGEEWRQAGGAES